MRYELAHRCRLWGLGLTIVLLLGAPALAEQKGQLSLHVHASGCQNDRGQLVARLFREGDDAPRGHGFRQLQGTIAGGRTRLVFSDLAPGRYAVFLFHDENKNGRPDHNFLGLPTEALGFSGGVRPSLLNGIPDFDDMAVELDDRSQPLRIELRKVL